MANTDFSAMPETAKGRSSTRDFGTLRPASAIHAGKGSMPAAWQTRGTPQAANHHEFGAPARSFSDILKAAFLPLLSSTPRKIALSVGIVLAVLILIF